MDKIIEIDEQYKKWIPEVSKRFRQSQIKAMVKVNDEKYIMASDLVDTVMKEAEIENYEVVATYKGEEFENMWLKHPLLDKKSRVILGGDNDLIVTLDAVLVVYIQHLVLDMKTTYVVNVMGILK